MYEVAIKVPGYHESSSALEPSQERSFSYIAQQNVFQSSYVCHVLVRGGVSAVLIEDVHVLITALHEGAGPLVTRNSNMNSISSLIMSSLGAPRWRLAFSS